jgi:hypothetical protein
MQDLLSRMSENLTDRISGPFKFRLILQPLMSVIFAIHDGLKDARENRPAYFWALFSKLESRSKLLREGWRSVGKVFIVASIVDVGYQFIVLRWIYPGEAFLVAVSLAIIPYLVVRGPVNRVARHKS